MKLFLALFISLLIPTCILISKFLDPEWVEHRRVAILCGPYTLVRARVSGIWMCNFLVKYDFR